MRNTARGKPASATESGITPSIALTTAPAATLVSAAPMAGAIDETSEPITGIRKPATPAEIVARTSAPPAARWSTASSAPRKSSANGNGSTMRNVARATMPAASRNPVAASTGVASIAG